MKVREIAKTKRTTKLQIDVGDRKSGGTNTSKKRCLFQTKEILNSAREFYTDFFLSHSLKFDETVVYFSETEQKEKERKMNNKEILSWAESLTLKTKENPAVLSGYGSKSRRLNRKLANQIKGKINEYAREKAFMYGTVTVETNPHGTSQYCSCCGEKGERFSLINGKREVYKGGKLFSCTSCSYTAHADFNASVNIHRSFYKEFHWEWKENKKKKPQSA